VLSFGGAKNGLMMGEFVINRNSKLKSGLKFFRKQSLQLPSKTRFLSAPFLKYLKDDLWIDIARQENRMAQRLREGLESIEGVEITQPTQANAVFCKLPKDVVKKLRKEFFFYVWDEKTFEVRLMTSFSTTTEHVDAFLEAIKKAFS
jgi:threonine aldolase